ncbi:MAG: transglycosylase domain-containing protein [Defluviitaleaceae bacterium]|nr:transglycosylase domain-containing protein [Defluviitaleaceae bacterium]MCL2238872.1 transglycosylase domain-containing protein [Defluviitaleaceae bacterium]
MDYSNFGNQKRRRQLNSQTTRVRNKISLLVLRVTLAVTLIGGLSLSAMGLGLWLGIIQAAPEMDWDDISSGVYSSIIICGRTGEELYVLHGGENRTFVTLCQISPHMINAIIAIEDERFWQHNGIDIRGIGRALHNALTTDGDTQGASTITQQLIKNTFGFFEGELVWKLQEQALAVRMERELTYHLGCRILAKEYILEMYLNEINLGRQNHGVQAAAMFYFGIDAMDLNIAQSAVIAAITQNPSRFPPDLFPERNWERAQWVLNNMLRLGFITEEEHFEAITTDVYATLVRDASTMAVVSTMTCYHDALVAQVRDDLIKLNTWTMAQAYREIFTGGLRIYSLQDLEMQAVVDRHFMNDENFPEQDFRIHVEFNVTVRDQISGMLTHFHREYTARNMEQVEEFKERIRQEVAGDYEEISRERYLLTLQPQAAFVLMDHHTGHVLALRGIRGEKQTSRSFCRATRATRSPGSQLKPLATFLPAFELGLLAPSTVIDDIPIFIPCSYDIHPPHRITNWYRNPPYEGLNTPRRAIYHSGNVVSVRATMDYVGIHSMWEYMHRLGFSTLVENRGGFTDRTYGLPLGSLTDGLLLIELAAAYGAIANGGLFNRPVLYSRVVDRNGNVILENHHEPQRVMRDTTAYLLIDTMKDTITEGTGRTINWIDNPQMRIDIPIAGKTGTSNDVRDLGFTGSTPYLTAAIWMGNDDNRSMSQSTFQGMGQANLFHRPLWRNIMQEIHEGFAPRQFDRPPGIITQAICRDSGLLPGEHCRHDPRGNRVRTEVFAPGTVPIHYCTVHQEHMICYESGQLAGWACHTQVPRVRLVRTIPIPEEFADVRIRDRDFEHHPSVRTGETCTQCHGFHDPWDEPWHSHQNDNWWDDWWGWGTQERDDEPIGYAGQPEADYGEDNDTFSLSDLWLGD